VRVMHSSSLSIYLAHPRSLLAQARIAASLEHIRAERRRARVEAHAERRLVGGLRRALTCCENDVHRLDSERAELERARMRVGRAIEREAACAAKLAQSVRVAVSVAAARKDPLCRWKIWHCCRAESNGDRAGTHSNARCR